jgi:hypothetical protein
MAGPLRAQPGLRSCLRSPIRSISLELFCTDRIGAVPRVVTALSVEGAVTRLAAPGFNPAPASNCIRPVSALLTRGRS